MTLPNFLIAGTSRSGTTSLFYYLRQHPDIGFAEKKEPKYFSALGLQFPHNGPGDHNVDSIMVRDFGVYERLFDGLEKYRWVGEASSDYLFHHAHSVPAIRQTLGDVPIIICLRNPVDRAFSAYGNLVRDQRETLSFEEALKAEPGRIAANWDWMWHYRAGGMYADQVNSFLTTFSRVKVVMFEEFVEAPQKILKELYEFLGVDSSFVANTSVKYSQSGKIGNRLLARLSSRDNRVMFLVRQWLLKVIPRSLMERLAANFMTSDEANPETRNSLREFYQPDVERLEKLLERSLDKWR